MSKIVIWVKPSGAQLILNNEEATIESARSMGWMPYIETEEGIAEARAVIAKVDGDKPKRKRRSKEEMQADANSSNSNKGDTSGNPSKAV